MLEACSLRWHASHNWRYRCPRVHDAQLKVAMAGQGRSRIGSRAESTVSPDESGSRKQASRYHSQALAWRSTSTGPASGGHTPKWSRSQPVVTPDVLLQNGRTVSV
jgi:hypothetical protein